MILEEMFNCRSLEVAAEIFAADFVDRRHEQVAGKKDGPEGFAQFVKSIRSALPDLRTAIQNIVAEGDYVAMWNTATALSSNPQAAQVFEGGNQSPSSAALARRISTPSASADFSITPNSVAVFGLLGLNS